MEFPCVYLFWIVYAASSDYGATELLFSTVIAEGSLLYAALSVWVPVITVPVEYWFPLTVMVHSGKLRLPSFFANFRQYHLQTCRRHRLPLESCK